MLNIIYLLAEFEVNMSKLLPEGLRYEGNMLVRESNINHVDLKLSQ